MTDPGDLISVRSDVAASLLIDGLFEEAVSRLDDPVDHGVLRLLASAANPRAARLGYLGRLIETERFEPAREPMPWLTERLEGQPADAAGVVSAALVEEEPLGKPSPADEAPSWRVPGPGGHVRHFLAVRAAGDGAPENKRSWLLGFFTRCCEEALATP